MKVCSLCHKAFTEFGNSAEPLNNGRCCDYCNHIVIQVRLNLMEMADMEDKADMEMAEIEEQAEREQQMKEKPVNDKSG